MDEQLPKIASHHMNDIRGGKISAVPKLGKHSRTTTLPSIYSSPRALNSMNNEMIPSPKAAIDNTSSVTVLMKKRGSENTESYNALDTPIICKPARIMHKRGATIDADSPQAIKSQLKQEKRLFPLSNQVKKQRLVAKAITSREVSGANSPIQNHNNETEEANDFFRLTGRSKDVLQKYNKYLDLCNYNDISKISKIESLRKKLFHENNRSRNFIIEGNSQFGLKSSPKNHLKVEFDFSSAESGNVQVLDQMTERVGEEVKTTKLPRFLSQKELSKRLPPKSLDVKTKPVAKPKQVYNNDDDLDFAKQKAIEDTYQNRFKKIEMVKNSSKAMDAVLLRNQFVRAQRENQRAKLRIDDFLINARKENERRRQATERKRLRNFKNLTNDVKSVYLQQNQQIEQFIDDFKAEFNISENQ